MTEDHDSAPAIGHNSAVAAIGTAEQWRAYLEDRYETARIRKQALLISFQMFRDSGAKIATETALGNAADLRKQLASLKKIADAIHAVEKAPVLVATTTIDGYRKQFNAEIDAAIETIRVAQTEYSLRLEAEERRRRQEIAEAAQREAAKAAALAEKTMASAELDVALEKAAIAEKAAASANASAADMTRTHGDMGAVSSLRSRWIFDPDDSDLMTLARAVAAGEAPPRYLAFNVVNINFAVRNERIREIPGCKIMQKFST